MLGKRKIKPLNDPSLFRVRLTPQMLDYDRFSSRSVSQYLPYVMSFNPVDFRSPSINTDSLGFRYAHTNDGHPISVGDTASLEGHNTVNLLVGASPSLGYGSTSDRTSLASRLAKIDREGVPWLNFSGHCYNSVQEVLLFLLHRHSLPPIRHITIMSGFNTLVMARLPELERSSLPPFYFCGQYYEKYDEILVENGGTATDTKAPAWPTVHTALPPIDETMDRGVEETMRRLLVWRDMAKAVGARLTFLMQPLATWVRAPNEEEANLFGELDKISHYGTWNDLYGDISTVSVGHEYADLLSVRCRKAGIKFANLVPYLADRPTSDWLFVDRAHFTDHGQVVLGSIIHDLIDGEFP